MNVICTGLSPLLHLCASGLIPKSSKITYLQYKNVYDEDRFSSLSTLTNQFAKDIAHSLGYKIQFTRVFEWNCPPAEERSKDNPISFEIPDIDICEKNLITNNSEFFLRPLLKGKKVYLFPEGASCFGLFDNNQINFYRSKLRPFLGRLSKKFLGYPYFLEKAWLLPDREGYVESFISSNRNFEVLNSNEFYKNYKICSDYMFTKYPELKLPSSKQIILHPFIEFMSSKVYRDWFNTLKDEIGDSFLFVKQRPRDMNIAKLDYIFSDFDLITIPKKYRELPAELFIAQTRMKYLGYYSTMILPFLRKDISIQLPPDDSIKARNLFVNAGLRRVLKLD